MHFALPAYELVYLVSYDSSDFVPNSLHVVLAS